MHRGAFVAAFVVLLGVGCASTKAYDAQVGKAASRASFDLGCDSSQLQVTVMDTLPSMHGPLPSTVGIVGCGKQAVYVYEIGAGWILNSAVQPTPTSVPALASEPAPASELAPSASPDDPVQ